MSPVALRNLKVVNHATSYYKLDISTLFKLLKMSPFIRFSTTAKLLELSQMLDSKIEAMINGHPWTCLVAFLGVLRRLTERRPLLLLPPPEQRRSRMIYY